MMTSGNLGICIDIIGAMIMGKAMFLETAKLTTNFGYIDKSGQTFQFYGPDRISDRCRELAQARLGLVLLIIGFVLQFFGQVNLCEWFIPLKGIDQISVLFLIIEIILIIYFELSRWDRRHRKLALFELWNRVDGNAENDEPRFLPAGLAWSETIAFMNSILKMNEPTDGSSPQKDLTLKEYQRWKGRRLKTSRSRKAPTK